MPRENSRAARANRAFWTDEKHIRPEGAVMGKHQTVFGGKHKIVNRLRVRFFSASD